MRYAWLTDIHLDHIRIGDEGVDAFIKYTKDEADVDGYFITGDISNSYRIVTHLNMLEAGLGKNVYFVLGNHDYYGSSIENVRKRMHVLTNHSTYLRYMPTLKFVSLNDNTALIGHDGWYDGLNGKGKHSKFLMNDWTQILDYQSAVVSANRFSDIDMQKVVETSMNIAMTAVDHVFNSIKEAVRNHNNIIILTHVPPWENAHIHNGMKGDADAQPWFTSRLMGQLLENAAKKYQHVNFTVYAGHTHGAADIRVADNLQCIVGGADYCNPMIQRVIEV